jgi:hypothetical protein
MPGPYRFFYCAGGGVSAWTGEAEDPVLRTYAAVSLTPGGRWPGAVV